MVMSLALREELRKLGKKGGKKSSDNMTPEQRSERARKAGSARWEKEKANEKHSH